MQLVKRFMTKNRCFTSPRKIKPTKLILHSLGVAQPNANVLINSWDRQTAGVSIHAFIMDNQIIQTLPWDYKGWHVGKGTKGSWNGNSIGVEICEPSGHKYKGGTMIGYDVVKNSGYFNKVYHNAVELFAYLCNEFSLDPLKDILCHSEVHKLGYGSNHADVMHWFPKHGASMDGFRQDVKLLMAKPYIPTKAITPESPEKDIAWAQEKLNKVLPGWFPRLKVDGSYGAKTRLAVLVLWDSLGWGKHMNDDGTKIGTSTREYLAKV